MPPKIKATNWEDVLKFCGSRQVRYVGQYNGYPAYRSMYNTTGTLVIYCR